MMYLTQGLHRSASLFPERTAHCRALIAGYKSPCSLEFRDYPLSSSAQGKILKSELRIPATLSERAIA